MGIADEIKSLREQYMTATKEMASLETTKAMAVKEQDRINVECSKLGITPEQLPSVIAENEKKINQVIETIKRRIAGEADLEPIAPIGIPNVQISIASTIPNDIGEPHPAGDGDTLPEITDDFDFNFDESEEAV